MILDFSADQVPSVLLNLGAQADAVAASDTATASLIALFKRGLQTQTTISGKLPTLVSGAMPVAIQSGAGITNAGTVTKSTASVTTASGTALAINANRKRALLLNPPTASAIIYLGFTATASVTTDIPLPPGKAWLEAFDTVHTGIFSAIMSSGTGSLLVFEWV